MRRILLLLPLLLFCAPHSKANDAQFCFVSNNPGPSSCTLTESSVNGTVVVVYVSTGSCPGSVTASVVHDTQTNNYAFADTNVGGGGTGCQAVAGPAFITYLYAHNPMNGSLTITTGTNSAIAFMWARFLPNTDVINTGSPLDTDCGYNTTKPAANASYNTCSIQSTQANDVFMYLIGMGDIGFCNFTYGNPSNGPTVTNKGNSICGTTFFMNYDNSGTNQLSGAPTAFTMNIAGSLDNSGGTTTQISGLLMTFKHGAGLGGLAKRKHPPYIIKFPEAPTPRMVRVDLKDYR